MLSTVGPCVVVVLSCSECLPSVDSWSKHTQLHNAYYMSCYKLYHRLDVGSTSTEKQIRQKVDPISP